MKPVESLQDAIEIADSYINQCVEDFSIPIADILNNSIGANMAVLADHVIPKGWMPVGFEQKAGYRVYRYKSMAKKSQTNAKENLSIEIMLRDGTFEKATIEISLNNARNRPLYRLFARCSLLEQSFEANDLFEALQNLRLELEKTGAKALVAGSRSDVYPSGMSRDMGGGRQAYYLNLGKSATELVDIFASAPAELVGTVNQQEQFHSKWVESLRKLRAGKSLDQANSTAQNRKVASTQLKLARVLTWVVLAYAVVRLLSDLWHF